MENLKHYILDTNILIQSPTAILGFDDNEVVITSTTLQELDGLKSAPGETGFNARETIRLINSIQESAVPIKLGKYPINNDRGCLHFYDDLIFGRNNNLPKSFSLEKPDNRIINGVLSLLDCVNHTYENTILVTNDISLRTNARMANIKVEGYFNDQIKEDSIYSGRKCINVSSYIIEDFFKNKKLDVADLITNSTNLSKEDLIENEYITLVCGTSTGLGVYKNNTIYNIGTDDVTPMGIIPKNAGQRFALNALLAPASEIPLVIIKGIAGSAKTFLSLAAALEQTSYGTKLTENTYQKVMITRNNILSDADIGFLPGDLTDKMGPLVMPFIDNLEIILKNKENDQESISLQIEEMKNSGILDICSMAYMRGRSISNSYLILDECQNATPGQILEIISRAGIGTKVILLGDTSQIDNPKLDSKNNGLAFASEKMKGSPLCAQITFSSSECVRSPLALEAIERLKK